jgi:hypothetical protein
MTASLKSLLGVALTLLALQGARTVAADTDSPAAETSTAKAADTAIGRPYPLNGKIATTDKLAMTITLEGKQKPRVIHVTSQTRWVKQGKPATFEDAQPGDSVGGQVAKNKEGQEVALSLRLGPKPEKPSRKKE